MCSNPITIPNPAYGKSRQGHFRHTDDISPTITVPCGCCLECQSLKSIFISQRLEMESLTHYIYYFTFTCDDEHIVRENFGGTIISRYPIEVVTKCIKRFRNVMSSEELLSGRDFKYYYVNEYGSSGHRPHLHGFFLIGKGTDDTSNNEMFFKIFRYLHDWWKCNLSVNIGTDSKPCYEPIFNYRQKFVAGKLVRNYDMQPVVVNGDNNFGSAYYINKYLYKLDDYVKYMWNVVYDSYSRPERSTPEYTRFIKHWNLFRPHARKSFLFGFPDNYVNTDMVNDMALRSLTAGLQYPAFISPYSGSSKPLCPYYRQYIAPSILDKFTSSEYDLNGCIKSKPLIQKPEKTFQPNLFDFTDIFF